MYVEYLGDEDEGTNLGVVGVSIEQNIRVGDRLVLGGVVKTTIESGVHKSKAAYGSCFEESSANKQEQVLNLVVKGVNGSGRVGFP